MICCMFTGIISNLGKVVLKNEGLLVIEAAPEFIRKFETGLSISVNGICLTVVDFSEKTFSINFMPETAKVTNIGQLNKSDLVNLELPATPQTFLAGHIVQGHVDCVGKISQISTD